MSRQQWCEPCAMAEPRRATLAAGLIDGEQPACFPCGSFHGDRFVRFAASAPKPLPEPTLLRSGETVQIAPGAVIGAELLDPSGRAPVAPEATAPPAGTHRVRRPRRHSDQLRQTILEADSSEPAAQLARRLGVSDVWVAKVRSDAGIRKPGRAHGSNSPLSRERRAAIIAEPRHQRSSEVALRHQVTTKTVDGLWRRHPLPAPVDPAPPEPPVSSLSLEADSEPDSGSALSEAPRALLHLTLAVTDAQCDRVFQNQPLARKVAMLATLPPEAWL